MMKDYLIGELVEVRSFITFVGLPLLNYWVVNKLN
jgi:hypothetical protein